MTTSAAKRHIDREPTHPGAVLREDVLPALQLSVAEAARRIHVSRQTLHAVLSPDVVRQYEQVTYPAPDTGGVEMLRFWIILE